MTQVGEKGLDTGNCKEYSAKDVQILCSDEVVNCLGRIICAEDSWVVVYDVDYSGDEKRCEPETDDGSKYKGEVFRTESLDEEL